MALQMGFHWGFYNPGVREVIWPTRWPGCCRKYDVTCRRIFVNHFQVHVCNELVPVDHDQMITHFLAPTETWEPRRFTRLFSRFLDATQMPNKMAGVNFGSCKVYEMQIITLYEVIQTWNSKQPVLCCCFSWMIPNLYIGNCCSTKHLFKHGCSEFQLYTHTHTLGCSPTQ